MTKLLLATLALLTTINSISQTKNTKGNIGISIPFIGSKYEATYYQLGSPKYPGGNAISYGLNISYSHPLYKGMYGIVGAGYGKQSFEIRRPFRYNSPVQLLYSTQSYSYNNIQLFAGAGYKKDLNKKISVNGSITYNYFNSYNQKYMVNKEGKVWQINKKSLPLGEMINFNFGIANKVSKKISVGADFIIPVYTHWNNDEIFINNYYSKSEQQIARNKFSAGVAISCNYQF